jgi:hypothetical protein
MACSTIECRKNNRPGKNCPGKNPPFGKVGKNHPIVLKEMH